MKKLLIIILILAVIYVAWTHHRIAAASAQVDSQWALVNPQFQIRMALMPSLEILIQPALATTSEVVADLDEARADYNAASSTDLKAETAGEVESAYAAFVTALAQYPQTAARADVQALVSQIQTTESPVSIQRTSYNEAVRSYNTLVTSGPSSVFAHLFGYVPRAYFDSPESAEAAVGSGTQENRV